VSAERRATRVRVAMRAASTAAHAPATTACSTRNAADAPNNPSATSAPIAAAVT
jgi:hypothetical protein